MFEFWDWVGGRYSMDSAIGLSTMIAIGPENFRAMLERLSSDGRAFSNHPFERNSAGAHGTPGPLVQQLLRCTNCGCLAVRAVPEALPCVSAAADHGKQRQACHARRKRVCYQTGPIYWGEPGTNGQHSFYQLIHQGTKLFPATSSHLRGRFILLDATTTCCWRTFVPRQRRWRLVRHRRRLKPRTHRHGWCHTGPSRATVRPT
jgi:hypothetical protein